MNFAITEAFEDIMSKGASLNADFLEKVLIALYEDGVAEGKAEVTEKAYDEGHSKGYEEGYAAALEELDDED